MPFFTKLHQYRRKNTRILNERFSACKKNYHITEKSEKYYPHTHFEKAEMCRREPELKLEGRFECQPEYRKAYIDYLIRERKSPAIQRRAFALVDNDDNTEVPNNDASETDTIQEKETSTLQVPDISTLNVNISTSGNTSSYASSMRSSPSLQTNVRQSRKLSQIEETAFGPKCSKTRETTTPSPSSRYRRKTQLEPVRAHSPRSVGGKFSRSSGKANVLLDKQKHSPENNKWSDSVDSEAAFLVLDDKNSSKKITTNNLYKEQKWMPSWKY